MTTTRDDAASASGPAEVGEASAFPSVRGLRWWAVLVLALVLTAGGVAADVLRAGTLGFVFLAAYPAGCILAALLAQRRDLFVPMVQPPLLLAVSVPVAVAATGSLPTSGGLVSTALAVGAPLINGFPAMAITTAVCVLIGVVRMRAQPYRSERAEARREPVRSGPSPSKARREPPEPDPVREREQAERERRRVQERARAERDRERAERDRVERERRERELTERERARRERSDRDEPPPDRRKTERIRADRPERDRPERDRPERDPDRPSTKGDRVRAREARAREKEARAREKEERAREKRARAEDDRDRLGRPVPDPTQPPARRSPLKGAGRDDLPPRPPRDDLPPRPVPPPADRDQRSREDRMREERLREERRGPDRPPPGVHPVRERPPEGPRR